MSPGLKIKKKIITCSVSKKKEIFLCSFILVHTKILIKKKFLQIIRTLRKLLINTSWFYSVINNYSL